LMVKKKRPHTDTTVPHIPADVHDIMAALLRTPPPKAGEQATRKAKGKVTPRKRRRS
jgi:hypothetical protein